MPAPARCDNVAKVSKEERRKRLDLVERTIQDRGWSGRVARALASRFDVEVRTVYRYRKEVLEEIAEGYRGIDKELSRGEFLLRLRENINDARTAGRWGPVASMLNMEGRVLGVFIEDEQRSQPVASLDEVVEKLQDLPQPIRERLAQVLIGAADG